MQFGKLLFMKTKYSLLLFAGLCAAGCNKTATINPANPNSYVGTVTPKEFLSDATFNKLIIEIDYVNGYQPTTAAVNNIVAFLQTYLKKPMGIEISLKAISSPGKQILTIDDIQAVEKNNRTLTAEGTTLTAYFFIADGEYYQNTSNSKVLGVAYGSTAMVLFEKSIKDLSGGIGQPSVAMLESTVAEHEFGHLLGLVNNGSPMISSHQDNANGKHCNNSHCLMYYATETSDVLANLVGNTIPTLDDNCVSDLKGNGGK